MSIRYKVLKTSDDGSLVIIGREDGQLQCLSSEELAQWDLAGLESDTMSVEDKELGNQPLPLTVSAGDEQLPLEEYECDRAPLKIIAAYSSKTNTWIVGHRTPPPF